MIGERGDRRFGYEVSESFFYGVRMSGNLEEFDFVVVVL